MIIPRLMRVEDEGRVSMTLQWCNDKSIGVAIIWMEGSSVAEWTHNDGQLYSEGGADFNLNDGLPEECKAKIKLLE